MAKKAKAASARRRSGTSGRRKRKPAKKASGRSSVIRHEKPSSTAAAFPPAMLTDAEMDLISDHLRRHVGPVKHVLHELLSIGIHLDINVIPPARKRPFLTLCTMGMSAVPMKLPRGYKGARHMELLMVLPPDWPLTDSDFRRKGENAYWPVRLLKTIARIPSDYDTFLAYGHTVPTGDPPEPVAPKCAMCCGMVCLPVMFEPSIMELKLGKKKVTFLLLVPLFKEEMDFKLENGADALIDRLVSEVAVTDWCNPKRTNVCSPG